MTVEIDETPDPPATGQKFDDEKDRWDLLPVGPIREVVRVLTFGSGKYGDDNWQQVPEARRRYVAAFHRHVAAWQLGEEADEETGINHLAHAICCLVFLLWFDQRQAEITGEALDRIRADLASSSLARRPMLMPEPSSRGPQVHVPTD